MPRSDPMPLNLEGRDFPAQPTPTPAARAVARVAAVTRRYSEVVLFGAGVVVGALLVALGRVLG